MCSCLDNKKRVCKFNLKHVFYKQNGKKKYIIFMRVTIIDKFPPNQLNHSFIITVNFRGYILSNILTNVRIIQSRYFKYKHAKKQLIRLTIITKFDCITQNMISGKKHQKNIKLLLPDVQKIFICTKDACPCLWVQSQIYSTRATARVNWERLLYTFFYNRRKRR